MLKYGFAFLFFNAAFLLFSQGYSRTIELTNHRMYGSDILKLQRKLVEYGFTEIGEIDGYYGPLTANVISKIQFFLGFEPNGKVEKKLWDSLFSEPNKELLEKIQLVSGYDQNVLRKISESRMGYSTEGGYIDTYFDGNTARKTDLFLFGEMGKAEYCLYYFDSDAFFIIEKKYYYHMPETDEEMEGYTSLYQYLFSEENLRKTIMESTIYYKDQNGLFQINEGNLEETSFDLNWLMRMVEHNNDA
ncbi:peptidoglycan-binding domain-containing protein [Breznakiella homolactica]|uniref:Peptidoglycan-binding protein n=1 Tax=Breznakiella homolactica TaxID=2798577 RepID=A0A7T7XLZ4_9SPIR|nr:peptidoglycan-binding domain-containing protein [Breznakiella homolactica]QQO08756.1 peptidoglycan-binding protein [Breznakiella homolactica]